MKTALVCLLLATVTVLATATNPLCFLIRQVDGSCNNPLHPEWGKSDRFLARGAEGVWYADGVREPVLEPNPRNVSNRLFRADDTILDPNGHNLLWVFFGQFVAHDLMGVHRKGDHNMTEISDNTNPDNFVFIPVYPDDVFYSVTPRLQNNYTRVLRSRGTFVNGRFEVGSESTAWLDLDVVYGKHAEVENKLRAYQNGLLKYGVYDNYTAYPGQTNIPPTQVAYYGEWLPLVNDVDPGVDRYNTVIPISNQLVTAGTLDVPHRFFASGDGRNGENYAINFIHGLFLREHNRIARQIKAAHPLYNDETIYQLARRQNIAQYQAIVMYEYLPSLLMDDYDRIGRYTVYNPLVDPTVSQLFAFAFRFGHTTVPESYYLKNECNQRPFGDARDGPRSGQPFQAQQPADQLAQIGHPNNLLHALLFDTARRVDPQFPETLRTIAGAGSDIIVANQVRAAENGIPDYHTIRKLWHGGSQANLYKLPGCKVANENTPAPDPIECFNYITSNYTVAAGLRDLYGKINKINFYTSVVAEDPTLSAVGRTAARIIADQFKRVRNGDRWWFENPLAGFTGAERRALKNTKMHDLLRRNFPGANVQDDAFYTPEPDHYAC